VFGTKKMRQRFASDLAGTLFSGVFSRTMSLVIATAESREVSEIDTSLIDETGDVDWQVDDLDTEGLTFSKSNWLPGQ
jgi:hypothetical protein